MEVIQIVPNRSERYYDSRLEVDFHAKAVVLDSRPVRLTRMEFRLLAILVQSAGDIVPRATLLMNVWGYGPEIRTRTLDVHIRRLRGKLRDYSRQHIETIFGIGYRLQPCRPQARLPQAASA
jgi:two-component system phosphate regulon response regulator PhoB